MVEIALRDVKKEIFVLGSIDSTKTYWKIGMEVCETMKIQETNYGKALILF